MGPDAGHLCEAACRLGPPRDRPGHSPPTARNGRSACVAQHYINSFAGALAAFREEKGLSVKEAIAVLGLTNGMWLGFFSGLLFPGPEQWRKVAFVMNWNCAELGELVLRVPREPSRWVEDYGTDRESHPVVRRTEQVHAQRTSERNQPRPRDGALPLHREEGLHDEDVLQTDRLLPVERGGSGPGDDVHRASEGSAGEGTPAQGEGA